MKKYNYIDKYCGNNSVPPAGKDMTFSHDPRKGRDKKEPKRWSIFFHKNDNKEYMNVNVSLVKFTTN